MNLKKLMKKLRKDKNAMDVNVPKIPTKKQVIKSRPYAPDTTHKNKMQK